MSNTMYDPARQAFATAQINWLTDEIRCVLVDTALYTFSALHSMLSDIPAGARVATSSAFTSKTVSGASGGWCDADDITFTALTGASIEALVIYKNTGVASTSPLLVYFDTITGLPFTPSGTDFVVRWAASGLFRL